MSSRKPVILDLFCGSGGASAGYYAAGFDVVGIDINPQPDYPFEFIQADVMEWLQGNVQYEFDLIHASPPCQGYTWGTRKGREDKWPKLINPVRNLLRGIPYVIENVKEARSEMINPILLCGTMFNLPLLRHRLFETNWNLIAPDHLRHRGSVGAGDYVTVAGHGGNNKAGNFKLSVQKEAMGIPWVHKMTDLVEMIPPEYIGKEFLQVMERPV